MKLPSLIANKGKKYVFTKKKSLVGCALSGNLGIFRYFLRLNLCYRIASWAISSYTNAKKQPCYLAHKLYELFNYSWAEHHSQAQETSWLHLAWPIKLLLLDLNCVRLNQVWILIYPGNFKKDSYKIIRMSVFLTQPLVLSTIFCYCLI